MKKEIVMEEKVMVTPKEIKNIEFGKGIKGYKEHEVDVFLDKVKETIEYLLQENSKKDDIIKEQAEKLKVYSEMEDTLKTTLITAQASATETCDSANKKATMMIEEATMKADNMIKNAKFAAAETCDSANKKATMMIQDATKKADDMIKNAQASATETCESANKKATMMIEEATTKADDMIKAAEKKVETIEKSYEEISNKYNTFIGGFKAMLETQMKDIDSYTVGQENGSSITE